MWNVFENKFIHNDEQIEPQKSCSTCGYSPMSVSCDSCEGYSNWWALEQTEHLVESSQKSQDNHENFN